jgi:hypothetical protein
MSTKNFNNLVSNYVKLLRNDDIENFKARFETITHADIEAYLANNEENIVKLFTALNVNNLTSESSTEDSIKSLVIERLKVVGLEDMPEKEQKELYAVIDYTLFCLASKTPIAEGYVNRLREEVILDMNNTEDVNLHKTIRDKYARNPFFSMILASEFKNDSLTHVIKLPLEVRASQLASFVEVVSELAAKKKKEEEETARLEVVSELAAKKKKEEEETARLEVVSELAAKKKKEEEETARLEAEKKEAARLEAEKKETARLEAEKKKAEKAVSDFKVKMEGTVKDFITKVTKLGDDTKTEILGYDAEVVDGLKDYKVKLTKIIDSIELGVDKIFDDLESEFSNESDPSTVIQKMEDSINSYLSGGYDDMVKVANEMKSAAKTAQKTLDGKKEKDRIAKETLDKASDEATKKEEAVKKAKEALAKEEAALKKANEDVEKAKKNIETEKEAANLKIKNLIMGLGNKFLTDIVAPDPSLITNINAILDNKADTLAENYGKETTFTKENVVKTLGILKGLSRKGSSYEDIDIYVRDINADIFNSTVLDFMATELRHNFYTEDPTTKVYTKITIREFMVIFINGSLNSQYNLFINNADYGMDYYDFESLDYVVTEAKKNKDTETIEASDFIDSIANIFGITRDTAIITQVTIQYDENPILHPKKKCKVG